MANELRNPIRPIPVTPANDRIVSASTPGATSRGAGAHQAKPASRIGYRYSSLLK